MSLQRAIIKHLLNGPTSLADLQLATQVSLPTLRRAVQELTDARWVRVVGQAEANGGRPAMLFGLDDGHIALVGVHLQLPGLRLILSDLTSQVLNEIELFENLVPAPGECVQAVVEYVAQMTATFPQRHLLGIGVATPGFIELETGDILSIGRVPTWGSFPMRRRLQAAVNLPVYIANDVDCMAFAELYFTHRPRTPNLAYVGLDEGVKVSLFLQGELYRSTLGNAGLIEAHLLRVPGVSEVGRFLTIAGVSALFEEQVANGGDQASHLYADIVAKSSPRERVQLIFENACPEMPVCQAIVQEQVKVLAAAITNMLLLIQPDVVVLGGLLSVLPPEWFAALDAEIRRLTPALIGNTILIQQGRLATQNSAALGANHHFLQRYLSEAGELSAALA